MEEGVQLNRGRRETSKRRLRPSINEECWWREGSYQHRDEADKGQKLQWKGPNTAEPVEGR